MMFRKQRTAHARAAINAPAIVDREFLSPALAILDTPASPIGSSLVLLICTLAALALVWAALGSIGIVAVAAGKLQPEGRVKTVQVLQTGRIKQVMVSNGSVVAAGDVLFTLDRSEIEAQMTQIKGSQIAAKAEAIRRQVAVRGLTDAEPDRPGLQVPAPPLIAWPNDIPRQIRLREDTVLSSDYAALRTTVSGLQAKIDDQRAQRQRLDQDILVQARLLGTLQQRVDMEATLQSHGNASRASLITAQVDQQRQAAAVVSDLGQRSQITAALTLAQSDLRQAVDRFVADNNDRRAAAERQTDEAASQAARAQVSESQMTVRSPVAGTVEALGITTIGQVFSVGQEALRLVPAGTKLQAEAYVSDRDAGFVQMGQPVVIKVDAFPFNRYGGIRGVVTSIASDAIPELDAENAQGNPSAAHHDAHAAGEQTMRGLVFPITVSLDAGRLIVDGRAVVLKPGMAVSAEIQTGSRSILSYLLSPVSETLSRSMKER